MNNLSYVFEKLYQISGLSNLTFSYITWFLVTIIFVFLLELVVVGWKKSSLLLLLKFEKTTQTDFYIWLTEILGLFRILAFIFSLGICYFLVGLIEKSFDFQLIQKIENGALQFAIVFILSDFKEYIKHYCFHKVHFLWEIHAFHHAAERFTILTAYRFHYLQTALGTFLDVIPFVILGVPIQTYFAVKIIGAVHGLIIHSNIEHNWGFLGKYILVSPAAHRIHHSTKSEHLNKNFAGKFIFWDRLFGTYYKPEKVNEIGIEDNDYNKKSFIYDVFLPLNKIYKSVSKFIIKPT